MHTVIRLLLSSYLSLPVFSFVCLFRHHIKIFLQLLWLLPFTLPYTPLKLHLPDQTLFGIVAGTGTQFNDPA